MTARTVPVLLALAALALAGCSTTEETTIAFPVFTGKRVIYTADANADDATGFGDEVYVADTGSASLTVTRIDGGLPANAYADAPFTLGANGQLGYRVVEDPTDGCPAHYNLVDRAGGPIKTFFTGNCVHEIAVNAQADRVVVMATVGTSGTNLYLGDPTDLKTVYQLNAGSNAAPGTVTDFAIATGADVIFWSDASGIHSADLGQPLQTIIGTLLNADTTTQLFATSNGVSVVYAAVGDERYKSQPTAGGAATFLTNALAGGDLLDRSADGARLNSTGAMLLYVAAVGGVKQLWRVTLATPLGESRADDAVSSLLQAGQSFEFSPDGGSYAWIGDGGTGNTLFQATVAVPAFIALTSVTEEPTGTVHWTDGSTVAYISTDADAAIPAGSSAVRTVNTGSPLTSTLMGADEYGIFVIGDIATCSDGTLVYDIHWFQNANMHTALYAADPQTVGSAVPISPEILAAGDEIGDIACVD